MDPKLIGAFGVLSMCCICSSIVSGVMSGGGDDSSGGGGGGGGGAGGDDSTPPYTESCDDLGGGVLVRHEADVDLDSCKTYCSNDLDCLGFVHTAATGFCQLHDNKDPLGVDVCDEGHKMYRDTTGKTPLYTLSCDDLGGGVIEKFDSDVDLSDCKTKCNADTSCEGIVHIASTGFCQLHDNNDPLGVDVCDQGYKMYRK